MKRIVALLVALGLVCGMTLGFAQAAEAKTIIKMAGMKPEGEPETIGMHLFGKYLAELSNGKYEVQVFPNSQLGKEDAYIAATRKGIIQMCATGTQTSALHPAMAMLETPMLFDDLDHARRAMEGKTFDLINEGFTEKSGLRTMNAFPLGFRHFYTKKPIVTVEDVKGLRMRVPNIPLYTNFAKECGISGQPMPFAEVPGALDQGVIDGGDSPLADIVSLKMYEITPQITLTGHILVIHSLYINDKFYQSLPAEDKKWFDEAAKRSADDVWVMVKEGDEKAKATILANKGSINTPSKEFHDYMAEAGKRSWKLFYDTVPNCQAILDSAASYRESK
ncbi:MULTISPECIES: TRAP transporter substrate-binding protein [Desulfovibrio]|uniref:DctP family TRAP transporter solute receptor n=2 Tax=root TaxID=1 RepID=A0A212KJG2_9BACT|nr:MULTISPECIES: TRAP transporter substrate-binding protein [Desulfovibrio]MBD8895205.1 TRAP transporter substrate-binding protein [Desulfovibrio desulfuricans]MBT9750410.1 ABC transporter substrate-binding protein [Desulfovibrio desulfuricans]MCB6540931.1 TRAP transporter substrate-binding protein DctP [Desulfovibrio desulfuricans]MCB6552013.1 TRAP transporter substrate-binding protein DctP [Desulfovibrio desulfuricans]MCB6563855.1 TRAP transporter substrate-binding protein DctP [Desulfovibri